MKKLIGITGLLLAGILVSAGVSAATYTYIGDMGDINAGTPTPLGTEITTQYVNGSASENLLAVANPDTSPTYHSYSFSASQASSLTALYEFGTDLESFIISFFVDGESNWFYQREFSSAEVNGGGYFLQNFADVGVDDFLIKIDTSGNGGANASYKVILYANAAPVPLPPAALLFVSALAGFGVIGRKKKSMA